MKTKISVRPFPVIFTLAVILLLLVSQFGVAVRTVSAASGNISGIISCVFGPVTTTSVLVRAVLVSDGSEVATTYSNPANGQYTLNNLPLDTELAVIASDEDPDTDYFLAEYYNNVTLLDWAEIILLTSGSPDRPDVDFNLSMSGVTTEHLTFNTRAGRILEDPAVRQAIAYGTDRQAILDTIFHPAGIDGEVLNTLIFPGIWYEAPDTDPLLTVYKYNPKHAGDLLDAAGWNTFNEDGYREKLGVELGLVFITTDAAVRIASASLFQAQMAYIGVRIDIYTYTSSVFFNDDPAISPLAAGDFDIAEFAWVLIDSDNFHRIFYTGDSQNFGGFSNSLMDSLWDDSRDAKVVGDTDAFLRSVLAWQYEYSDDLPALPLLTRVTTFITGVIQDGDGIPITGTPVLVRAILKSDSTEVASTFTDPADGTYMLTNLPVNTELAVIASDEDPATDGYYGKFYYNVANLDWAIPILLTSALPYRHLVYIQLTTGLGIAEQFTFNVRSGRLLNDEMAIRIAIGYGTDRQSILDDVFELRGITGEIMNTLVYPGAWYDAPPGDPSLTVYTYDPIYADDILDAAGWDTFNVDGYREKDSVELALDFITTNAEVRVASAAMFQEQMEDIGIRINIYIYTPAVFFDDDPAVSPLLAGNFDIAEFGWLVDDSDSFIGNILTAGHPQNYGGYDNNVLDDYYNAARTARLAFDGAGFLDNALHWQYVFALNIPDFPLFLRENTGATLGLVDVSKAGAGTGTVTSSPSGIDCGTDCTESLIYGAVVMLSASPAAGSVFTGWSGACTGTGDCAITVDADNAVTATFAPAYTLNVSKAGTGSGTVTSSPVGINCGTDCTEAYASGTVVRLTASPASGSVFSGWSGACGGTGDCWVTMTAARSVTATFTAGPPGTNLLTVSKLGTGTGHVVSTPVGIDCGVDCSEFFTSGITVRLTAVASAGSTFTGWSGACGGTGQYCWVTMNLARLVKATFVLNPPGTQYLGVSKTGTGTGTVVSLPVGIDCGVDCSQFYTTGTVVRLGAVASAGSTFTGWSGACGGTGYCWVTMTAARFVRANFLLNPPGTFYLGVQRKGTGNGTVTSAPAGISCGVDCSEFYASGTVVKLTAIPAGDSTFAGWSGACGGSGFCWVTMTAVRYVYATFNTLLASLPPLGDIRLAPSFFDGILRNPLLLLGTPAN